MSYMAMIDAEVKANPFGRWVVVPVRTEHGIEVWQVRNVEHGTVFDTCNAPDVARAAVEVLHDGSRRLRKEMKAQAVSTWRKERAHLVEVQSLIAKASEWAAYFGAQAAIAKAKRN